jgi:hypothetical protein
MSGTIGLIGKSSVSAHGSARITSETGEASGVFIPTRISFTLSGPGDAIYVKPKLPAVPITISLDQKVELPMVHVGNEPASPSAHEFVVELKDRHGMAWGDIDGNGISDVAMIRGGLQGNMVNYPGKFFDELFVWREGRYLDQGHEFGLEKRGCPGRQVAWTDIEADNDLDLYIVCGRGRDPFPNQLFRRDDSSFAEVAADAGVDLGADGKVLWMDIDDDGDLDLFWASRETIEVLENDRARFERTQQLEKPVIHATRQLLVADVDGNGTRDVMSISPQKNTLYLLSADGIEAADPSAYQLPDRSQAAGWADMDNDGDLDFVSVPQGVYSRDEDGHFIHTEMAALQNETFSIWRATEARVSVADFDNDGDRDLLIARKFEPRNRWIQRYLDFEREHLDVVRRPQHWTIHLLENRQPQGNWLSVDVLGPGNNPLAVGAKIKVTLDDGQQVESVVGDAETSEYSQGHFRVYFGFGTRKPAFVQVSWLDGVSTEIRNVHANRLITIARPDHSEEKMKPTLAARVQMALTLVSADTLQPDD